MCSTPGRSWSPATRFVLPQLLWVSGIRPDALGRYLNNQPQVMAASLLDEKCIANRDQRISVTKIAAGKDPTPSFADGLQVQRVLAAVESSSQTGQWTPTERN